MNVKSALRDIGLALHAANGVIASDDPALEPDEKTWRIDHSKAIGALEYIESALMGTGTCPECGNRKTCPSTPMKESGQRQVEEPCKNRTSSPA